MIRHTSQYAEKVNPVGKSAVSTPSRVVEYGFYLYMCYFLLGGAYGLFVNNLASALLVVLVLLCLYEVGFQAIPVIRLLAFPLGCGVAYTCIQLFFFESAVTVTVRPFLIWMMTLVLVQSLALRANFLHRFVLVMFFIGLAALPYLSFNEYGTQAGKMLRAQIDGGIEFGHTNAVGNWYGFCAVYFLLRGWIARTSALRSLSWLIAVGCLYVVTLTVSRGALLAVAIAIVMASRHVLKNGLLPLLLAACVGWIVLELGIFEQATQVYAERGTEDSGRLAVWPLIIDSFLDSPWIGVGDANTGAITARGTFVTPHNGFLYLAQSSGIVPLALFIAYWLRAGRAAFQADVGKSPDAIFYLPFFTFSFITVNASNVIFLQLWVIVSLAIPLTVSVKRQAVDIPGQVKRGVEAARFEIAK